MDYLFIIEIISIYAESEQLAAQPRFNTDRPNNFYHNN